MLVAMSCFYITVSKQRCELAISLVTDRSSALCKLNNRREFNVSEILYREDADNDLVQTLARCSQTRIEQVHAPS